MMAVARPGGPRSGSREKLVAVDRHVVFVIVIGSVRLIW